MAWDEAHFDRFVRDTVRMARGELPGYGYRHVVFPYPPSEEVTCIARLRTMPARLAEAGLATELVPVAQFVTQAVKRYAGRVLRDAEEYTRLEADLSDPRDGVIVRGSGLCRDMLVANAPRGAVALLCRLGALYPFGHVSTFLEALQQLLQEAGRGHTLAVAYPGTAEGTRLRFLGLVDPTGGYRGHIVT